MCYVMLDTAFRNLNTDMNGLARCLSKNRNEKEFFPFTLFLSLAMIFALSIPASALDVDSSDDSIQASFEVEKEQVSAEIVEGIFANHALPATASIDAVSEQELSTDDIDRELSHIYIDIERAQENYLADPTSGNESALNQLIQRKDFLENTLKSRGFIFLTDDEAQQLLGASSRATGSKPADTDNTRYVASSILSVTLSDNTKVKYYYVTAYAESTDSNMVRRALIEMDKAGAEKVADFIDALVETYVGKLVGTAASLVKGVAWLPYEMLTYSDDINISCSYTIQATYTTTPRFIWALSESLGNYQLEGVTHSTYKPSNFEGCSAYMQNTGGYPPVRKITKKQGRCSNI